MEEKTPLQKVVDIFNDYYGEDRVDLQGNVIMVYFPHVTVTNEHDRSIDITELYAKVAVESNGCLLSTFTFNRSEYTAAQYHGNYMHSHVRDIPKNRFNQFQYSCLGSGPIKDTCLSLNRLFDEDIWRLFTLELDKYVHTESVSGIPYHYLEKLGIPEGRISEEQVTIPSLGAGISVPMTLTSQDILLNRFLPYLLEKKPLSFNFIDRYCVADSPYNIVVKVSNTFIEWFNTMLTSEEQALISTRFREEGVLMKCKAGSGVILKKVKISSGFNPDSLRSLIGRELWTFKGNRVRLNITDIPTSTDVEIEEDENTSTLLEPSVVMYIIYKMLRVINYRYGKTNSIEPGENALYL